jgi:hypothetical protein
MRFATALEIYTSGYGADFEGKVSSGGAIACSLIEVFATDGLTSATREMGIVGTA